MGVQTADVGRADALQNQERYAYCSPEELLDGAGFTVRRAESRRETFLLTVTR